MTSSSVEYRKLILGSFVSQIGSHFLTLALSAYTLQVTGSAVKASLVFVFSYLPAAIAGKWVGPVVDQKVSKTFLALVDGGAALVSLLCGLSIIQEWPVAAFVALLSVRSILNMAQRSSVMKWIKTISEPDVQASRFQTFLLLFFVSTGISGALAALALSTLGVWGTVLLNVATYGFAIFIYLLLRPLGSSNSAPNHNSESNSIVSILRSNQTLLRAFATVLIAQAVFQGAYAAFVTYLPQQKFALGTSGAGYYQIAASIGIVLGWIVCRKFPTMIFSTRTALGPYVTFAALTLGALFACFSVGNVWVSIVLFCMLNAGFELLWLSASSVSFATVPSHATGRFQYAQASLASVLMAMATLVYAVGADQKQLAFATSVIVLVGFSIVSGVFIWSRKEGVRS